MRIEGHTDMRGLLFLQHFVEGVTEADNGTRIQALRVDSRILDEGVI